MTLPKKAIRKTTDHEWGDTQPTNTDTHTTVFIPVYTPPQTQASMEAATQLIEVIDDVHQV